MIFAKTSRKTCIHLHFITVITFSACAFDDAKIDDASNEGRETDAALLDVEAADVDFRALATGIHGNIHNPKVHPGGVVNQELVQEMPSNPNEEFWGFCGQGAAATAINFARGTSPSKAEKITQLNWFHERLLDREPGYRRVPARPIDSYNAHIAWLFALLRAEKSDEFTVASLTTPDREQFKTAMGSALDQGAFIVALNQTPGGVGHFLTVYAINFQPEAHEGGTVYYGDPLYGDLRSVGFKTFLDRMLSQSNASPKQYNAFSVKEK